MFKVLCFDNVNDINKIFNDNHTNIKSVLKPILRNHHSACSSLCVIIEFKNFMNEIIKSTNL